MKITGNQYIDNDIWKTLHQMNLNECLNVIMININSYLFLKSK